MSIGSTLAAGRCAAEAEMVDSCVITRPVHSDTLDEHTGEYVVTYLPVYTGPCKFKTAVFRVRDVDSQGQDLAVANGILAVPVGAVGSDLVAKNHVATITLAAYDAGTITAVVQAGFAQTLATARRFPVDIIT